MAIPTLDLSPEIKAHLGEFTDAFKRVLESGHFIMGNEVKCFESEMATYLGVKHAIGVNSGTDALVIGLHAMGIKPGDEVITTAFTFFATAEAISQLGAKPVFVDIEPDSMNLNAELIERAITPKTRAIMPVHIFGNAADMPRILQIAKKHNLKVIEDTAQAMGASCQKKKLGTWGEVGAYSFFPSKNLGGFGDGGLISTDNDEIATKCRMLRAHGSLKKYYNEILGFNSRLDEMQAAFLRIKLRYLDQANAKRRDAAHRYNALFRGVDWVQTPTENPQGVHSFHQYTIRVSQDRDQVQTVLTDNGISTMIYYPVPLHQLPIYQSMRCSLPETERAAKEVLSLPLWPEITVDVQQKVVNCLKGCSFKAAA